MVITSPTIDSVILLRKIFIFCLCVLIGYSIFAEGLSIAWKIILIFVTSCLILNLVNVNKRDREEQKRVFWKTYHDSFGEKDR